MRWTVGAAVVAVATVTITLVTDPSLRGRGTFPNPNLPAHLLGCAFLLFASAPVNRRFRMVVLAVASVGLCRTRSFGSALQLGAGFAYVLVTSLVAQTRGCERVRIVFFAGMALVVVATVVSIASYLDRPGDKQEPGSSATRLDKSSATRFETWGQTLGTSLTSPSAPVPEAAAGWTCS